VRRSVLALALLVALGCGRQPSGAELDALHDEAVRENAARATQYASRPAHEAWSLSIQGEATPLELDWSRLDALATTHIKTSSPVRTRDTKAVLDYRGVLLSKLLEVAHAKAGADSLTFVASDGFIASVDAADARRFPIMLAVELDGKPIARSDGGPLLLAFPESDFPEVRAKYKEVSWCFYAMTMIVGREPASLDVDGTMLNEQALRQLPMAGTTGLVKYRFGWPSAPVATRGPRLRDVLARGGVKLDRASRVVVRGKQRGAEDARRWTLSGGDVLDCDAYLALTWGDDNAEIPAKMGGPLTLVVPDACHFEASNWPGFVTQLHVESGDAGP